MPTVGSAGRLHAFGMSRSPCASAWRERLPNQPAMPMRYSAGSFSKACGSISECREMLLCDGCVCVRDLPSPRMCVHRNPPTRLSADLRPAGLRPAVPACAWTLLSARGESDGPGAVRGTQIVGATAHVFRGDVSSPSGGFGRGQRSRDRCRRSWECVVMLRRTRRDLPFARELGPGSKWAAAECEPAVRGRRRVPAVGRYDVVRKQCETKKAAPAGRPVVVAQQLMRALSVANCGT